MKERKVGIGIIGTGAIAALHLKCIREIHNAEIIAMASSSEARAEETRKKFGVKVYGSYQSLLQDEAIDAVIIGTHSGNHLAPTLEAAKMGKHVLVEKPIEINTERADQMISTCEEAGVKLGVIFQNRFSPDYMKLKAAVDAGKLGKLMLGNAYIKWFRAASYYENSTWKGTLQGDGGAALINQGIHTIDLLINIMGDVDQVFGNVRTVRHKIEGEDLGLALLTFKSGALGTIEGSTAIVPGYPERLEIFGTKGSVILEGGKIAAWNIEEQNAEQNISEEENQSGSSDPMAINYLLHKTQISDFVEALLYDRQPIVDGLEGKKSLTLIQGIYESAQQEQEIKL
ncbi:MAG: Gfo/Idh/MocA family oxidoreductase [Bacteroidota bacterium]